jgi:hypothetical protein
VFEILGKEPLIELATALEAAALNDEYFVSRKLYPNVDFYTGVIYKAMGFPTGLQIGHKTKSPRYVSSFVHNSKSSWVVGALDGVFG